MSTTKENRRVGLKPPEHVPGKLVREEKPLLSPPKTRLIIRMPLKRKRGENEDQDELEDSPSPKFTKQEHVSDGSSDSEDITESEEDTHENPRGVEDTIHLPPPVQLKHFAARKNPFPPAVGGVKLPHDFSASFKPHFTADKRKLHARCNVTIDLTFKRVPTFPEIVARRRGRGGWRARSGWRQRTSRRSMGCARRAER